MNKKILFAIVLYCIPSLILAQDLTKISVSIFKSTFIYFDDQVISIDLGLNDSYDATFDKNFVRLTAIEQKADYITNLTVVTNSGIFGFLVDYKETPERLYYFPEDYKPLRNFKSVDKAGVQSYLPARTEQKVAVDVQRTCENVSQLKMDYPIAAFTEANVYFSLDRIYVQDDKFYLKVLAQNESNIDYDIDFVKFHVKNKRKLKRASQQEVYKEPIYSFNSVKKLKANSSVTMVFVLHKFTIMNDKQFFVEIEEKGGERNILIQVPQNDILNAVEI